MTRELTSFSEAEDEFYDIVCDVKGLMSIATVLHKTESPEIPKAINKLTRKLQNQKDRLLEIKTFTDNIDHDHPCYDVDMTEALGTIKNQLSWLNIVEDIYYKTHVYNLDNKQENPMDLTQIIEGLKEDRHNIVDLFFEKIQTYKNESRTYSLIADVSNSAAINFHVETDISIGQIQGPFLKIFTLAADETDSRCTKDKLYTIIDEQTKTFEQTINNPTIKKKITVTLDDKRRLTNILDDEEIKYFLKELATYETECASSEDWLTWTDHANKIQQIDYYRSLKTDRERQIYATAIGHQYALDFLCSPIEELLKAYDLDVVNTFFKTVELVIN